MEGWSGVAGRDLVGCEDFEKKAEVGEMGDVGVRYGDMEVEGMGIVLSGSLAEVGAPVSLVLHFDLTSISFAWTHMCSMKYPCNQECYRLLLH